MSYAKRLHLNTVGIASCGQRSGELADFTDSVTCKFCQGILNFRRLQSLPGHCELTTQQWLLCWLHGKQVWAASSRRRPIVDDDGRVTVVYSLEEGAK